MGIVNFFKKIKESKDYNPSVSEKYPDVKISRRDSNIKGDCEDKYNNSTREKFYPGDSPYIDCYSGKRPCYPEDTFKESQECLEKYKKYENSVIKINDKGVSKILDAIEYYKNYYGVQENSSLENSFDEVHSKAYSDSRTSENTDKNYTDLSFNERGRYLKESYGPMSDYANPNREIDKWYSSRYGHIGASDCNDTSF